MLHAPQAWQLRQIQHLARLRLHDRLPRQIPTTILTLHDGMHHLVIRDLAALQMMTGRARLTTRLTSRTPPQTPLVVLRRRLRIPIRRRRPRRVARVLTQPRTQLGDQRLELNHPPRLLSDQRVPPGDQRVPLGDQHRQLREPRLKLQVARLRRIRLQQPCAQDSMRAAKTLLKPTAPTPAPQPTRAGDMNSYDLDAVTPLTDARLRPVAQAALLRAVGIPWKLSRRPVAVETVAAEIRYASWAVTPISYKTYMGAGRLRVIGAAIKYHRAQQSALRPVSPPPTPPPARRRPCRSMPSSGGSSPRCS